MARFLLVLQPSCANQAGQQDRQGDGKDASQGFETLPERILGSLEPVLQQLNAEVDHRTRAHLSALLRQEGDSQRMQLFADVQSKHGGGKSLELVLLSRESMGLGAPRSLEVFERLVTLCLEHLPEMRPVFRSDQDGPLPRSHHLRMI
jgi:hypothetical protein